MDRDGAVRGGSLSDILRDSTEVLDDRIKARISAETATGIAYLHMREISIIHGDIKSARTARCASVILARQKPKIDPS